MTVDFLRRLAVFVAICLAQVLVLNRIQLFHCATPLLCVYFTMIIPRGYPRWATLLWSFFMGLFIDMFANTPGVTAASMTLAGLLQPYLLESFLPREADEAIKASAESLGGWRFFMLASIITVVFCLVFFALEAFSFFNIVYWLQCAAGSAVVTLLLTMTLEAVRK